MVRSALLVTAFFSPFTLLIPSLTQAEILFYEGFDYSPGEDGLTLQGPWAAPATADASSDILPGSLTYRDALGNTLLVTGNHVYTDTAEEAAQVDNSGLVNLVNPNDPTSTVRWFSCLMQKHGPSLRFAGLSFRANDNTLKPSDSNTAMDEIFNLGTNTGQDPQNFRVADRAAVAFSGSANSPVSAYELGFLVLKVEVNVEGTNRERYTLWVNPRLDQEPEAATGYSFDSPDTDLPNWGAIHTVRLSAGTTNAVGPATNVAIDEIRVGEQFADIAPFEPSFQISTLERQVDGKLLLKWQPKENRLDTVEYSTDLATWVPVPDSVRTGFLLPVPAEHEVLVDPAALVPGMITGEKLFFRLNRKS